MDAELLLDQRTYVSPTAFVERVVWKVPHPVRASEHVYKYRLALVVENVCVLRYDNEAGKGDHRHLGRQEEAYAFVDIATVLADFQSDVERWLDENRGH